MLAPAVDAAFYERFAREAPGAIAPDLLAWSLAALGAALPAADRRRQRDRWLAEVAGFFPGVARWVIAGAIRAELIAIRRAVPTHVDTGSLRGCVVAASAFCPPDRTLSQKQIDNVLKQAGL